MTDRGRPQTDAPTAPIVPVVADRLRSLGAGQATLECVTVGRAALVVELADVPGPSGGEAATGRHTAGLAHRPPGAVPSTGGTDVETLLRWAAATPVDVNGAFRSSTRASTTGPVTTPVQRALGVATVNALSVPHVHWTVGDPMALLDPAVDTIATVGLFRPAFRKFDDVGVRVVERRDVGDVTAPDGVQVETFRPEEATAAFEGADVVFVTGSAFVYGGVEGYLDAVPPSATVVVVGATASFLPGPLFDAGVDVVAGAAVTDADEVRAAVRSGACGTDLHDAGVEKVYVVNERSTARGLVLRGSGPADASARDDRNGTVVDP